MMLGMRYGVISCMMRGQKSISVTPPIHPLFNPTIWRSYGLTTYVWIILGWKMLLICKKSVSRFYFSAQLSGCLLIICSPWPRRSVWSRHYSPNKPVLERKDGSQHAEVLVTIASLVGYAVFALSMGTVQSSTYGGRNSHRTVIWANATQSPLWREKPIPRTLKRVRNILISNFPHLNYIRNLLSANWTLL